MWSEENNTYHRRYKLCDNDAVVCEVYRLVILQCWEFNWSHKSPPQYAALTDLPTVDDMKRFVEAMYMTGAA